MFSTAPLLCVVLAASFAHATEVINFFQFKLNGVKCYLFFREREFYLMEDERFYYVNKHAQVQFIIPGENFGRTLADPGNGEIIPVDIALDGESMIVFTGTPDPPQDCFKQTINLHDFNKGLVAIKIVDKSICLIKSSNETYQDVAESLKDKSSIKQATEEFAVGKDFIEPEDVESRFGSLIDNFCTGYDVFEMEEGQEVNGLARRAGRGRRFLNINICILCFL